MYLSSLIFFLAITAHTVSTLSILSPVKAILLPIDVALPKVTSSLVEASIHAAREAFPFELGSMAFFEESDW